MTIFYIFWIVLMCFIMYFAIGCIILIPFIDIIIKVSPTKSKSGYSTDQENLKQIITWPRMLYKIYKYKRNKNGEENYD